MKYFIIFLLFISHISFAKEIPIFGKIASIKFDEKNWHMMKSKKMGMDDLYIFENIKNKSQRLYVTWEMQQSSGAGPLAKIICENYVEQKVTTTTQAQVKKFGTNNFCVISQNTTEQTYILAQPVNQSSYQAISILAKGITRNSELNTILASIQFGSKK